MNIFDNVKTVRELLPMEVDIDVYDDYDERIGIAFCGPCRLTTEGEEMFAPVLDLSLDYYDGGWYGPHLTLKISDLISDDDESLIELAKKFFYACAGYCSVENWEKWFEND